MKFAEKEKLTCDKILQNYTTFNIVASKTAMVHALQDVGIWNEDDDVEALFQDESIVNSMFINMEEGWTEDQQEWVEKEISTSVLTMSHKAPPWDRRGEEHTILSTKQAESKMEDGNHHQYSNLNDGHDNDVYLKNLDIPAAIPQSILDGTQQFEEDANIGLRQFNVEEQERPKVRDSWQPYINNILDTAIEEMENRYEARFNDMVTTYQTNESKAQSIMIEASNTARRLKEIESDCKQRSDNITSTMRYASTKVKEIEEELSGVRTWVTK